jgi:hypothetical protein
MATPEISNFWRMFSRFAGISRPRGSHTGSDGEWVAQTAIRSANVLAAAMLSYKIVMIRCNRNSPHEKSPSTRPFCHVQIQKSMEISHRYRPAGRRAPLEIVKFGSKRMERK